MNKLTSELESILFAAGEPVIINRISQVLGVSDDDVIDSYNELNEIYSSNGHSLCVVKMEDKLQMCSSGEYSSVIAKILETRKLPMLSNPALEALSIIAYFQPTTLNFVNKVRGVDSSYSVGTLEDKGLIAPKGRMDAPGRPILYGTTDVFLRTMGISSLDELPPLPDMKQNDAMEKLLLEIEQLSASTDNSEAIVPIPGQLRIEENTLEQ